MMCKVFSNNDFNNTKYLKGGKIGFKGGKVPPPSPYVENTLQCLSKSKYLMHVSCVCKSNFHKFLM